MATGNNSARTVQEQCKNSARTVQDSASTVQTVQSQAASTVQDSANSAGQCKAKVNGHAGVALIALIALLFIRSFFLSKDVAIRCIRAFMKDVGFLECKQCKRTVCPTMMMT